MDFLTLKIEENHGLFLPFIVQTATQPSIAQFKEREHADLFVSAVVVTELRKVLGDEKFNAAAAYILQGQHSLAS